MDKESKELCQKCGKHNASIHITDFVEGKPVKKYICQRCYESEEGVPALSSSDLFAKLVGIIAPELRKAGKQRCTECGMDYIEFRQNFKFGCANDYPAFRKALDELFEDLHGANRHTGKIPEGKAQGLSDPEQRLEILHRELGKAVEREDFERAAHLKNNIDELEQTSVRDTEE